MHKAGNVNYRRVKFGAKVVKIMFIDLTPCPSPEKGEG